MFTFLLTVALLGMLGFIGSLILYFTSKRFHVDEDPRIDEICSLLPGANCGGCGFKGCRDFATRCVKQENVDGLFCPVSGQDGMSAIAAVLGVKAKAHARKVAVLKCAGSCQARPAIHEYMGVRSCAVMDSTGVGTTGCSFGCLGCGDCVAVCQFGALSMNPETGLSEIDAARCTACGACVAECPRHLIELRPAGKNDRRVWVACSSRDKGAVARKVCSASCIGCGKCSRECPCGAIEVKDNLAYINPALCSACGKCVEVCPTKAIHATFSINLNSAES